MTVCILLAKDSLTPLAGKMPTHHVTDASARISYLVEAPTMADIGEVVRRQ